MKADRSRNLRRLLRVKDAAEYLSMSPWKLRALIQAGELLIIKTSDGNSPWLIDQRDLDAWIESRKGML
jgi:excisionase family DNA binding protein